MDHAAQATMDAFPSFRARVDEANSSTKEVLDIMQINVGRICNLGCKHCHVDAGPSRTEVMSRETLQQCLDVFCARGFKTLDVTGGAPEMNPDFEWLLDEIESRGINAMIRSNLVILQKEGYQHLPARYAAVKATVVASLPHYDRNAMERQRGAETFDSVIALLQQLNGLGYGHGGGLELDLVFNPGGAFLPPDQAALEKEYKEQLRQRYDIVFDNLFAITNNPLGRFGNFLNKSGNLEGYMTKLIGAFNAATLPHMMCRNQISVGWEGGIYDCDFNQAAMRPSDTGLTIVDYAHSHQLPLKRTISFGNHCYACCAGSGSSCGGATA